MSGRIVFPDRLFRYRRFDTDYAFDEIRAAVERQQVFLSSAYRLNDPFDFSPVYQPSELKEVLADLKATHGSKPIFDRKRISELSGRRIDRKEYRRLVPRMKVGVQSAKLEVSMNRNAITDLRRKSKLACFSERSDCIPMWAHYSNNHSGFCIWYDVLPIRIHDELLPLKVEYGTDRPFLTTLQLRRFMSRSKVSVGLESEKMKVFSAMYLHKSNDWSYEREWRVFDSNDEQEKYRTIPCLKVAAIAFGISCSRENIEKVRSILGDKTRLLQATQSSDKFSLDFGDLN